MASNPDPRNLKSWSNTIDYGKEKIIVRRGELFRVLESLGTWAPKASRFVIISDQNVWKLWGPKIQGHLAAHSVDFLVHAVRPGEETKSRETKEEIEDFMLKHKCGRDTCILAIGGGVVGDLAGFVAATYMRGIPFIQIPTTLLAMVDSSIGGKTGVDTPTGKNLIGAFHHPLLVCIDPEFLSTLDSRQYYNGFAEIIKTAAIRDVGLYQFLETNSRVLAAREDSALLEQVILRTAANKAYIVSIDSTEQGVRSTLNFGHTIGHAIEALSFPGLLHGECVAIGMVLETKLSNFMGHLESSSTVGRLTRVLQAYSLPVTVPTSLSFSELLSKMSIDKKNAGSQIRTTIICAIGRTIETPMPVDTQLLQMVLQPAITVVPQAHPLSGKIIVPGSKSLSNRVLTLAALGVGECHIEGLLHADDTQHMLDALEQFGVSMNWDSSGVSLCVQGSAAKLQSPAKPLYLGNAGTASRFLTSLCALLPKGTSAILTGSSRLKERPIKDLIDALRANGVAIDCLENQNHFPLRIHGGGLKGGAMTLDAEVSSQFVSSILLSAPYAQNPVSLTLEGKVVSQPFIDMTLRIMEPFGVRGEFTQGEYRVPCGVYQNPSKFIVEADASSASYPLAMAAITGGEVTVLNVGSRSLQGDARFAVDVLERMGCIVIQTDTTTTVQGPPVGHLKAIDVDMEPLTDTFMTAAVLMCVATGTSRITGIANQRVKECNRIAAMVSELTKLGFSARELPDGLEIVGRGDDFLKIAREKHVPINCYKDHRIAMSFAVLGNVVSGICITDKECVDKTYPEFWVSMRDNLGMKVEPACLPLQQRSLLPNTTVVVVGMRASGKSTMGKILAQALNRTFIDMDHQFERLHGPIAPFVSQHGWGKFRQIEYELLFEYMGSHETGSVIATGGGVVETLDAAARLKNSNCLVIQLIRPIEEISKILAIDAKRAALGEPPEQTWSRRQPLYEMSSHYEFAIPSHADWEVTGVKFVSFTQRILSGVSCSPAADSFFLCVTAPTMEQIDPVVFEGVHAVELRVDMLASQDADFVRFQLGYLRQITDLPIIYTVRTVDEGGHFHFSAAKLIQLLEVGKRGGCEYIDFQAAWERYTNVVATLSDTCSTIIVSVHDYESPPSEQLTLHLLKTTKQVSHHFKSAFLKVVLSAGDPSDAQNVLCGRNKFQSSCSLPCICIAAGEKGRLTRVLNRHFTPVTHPKLTAAAPGQLSAHQIISMKSALGM